MAYKQATQKQKTQSNLDESMFCQKMVSKGYFCEKCSVRDDMRGKDFIFSFPGNDKKEHVDVKGFKKFTSSFKSYDKDHTFIEIFLDKDKVPGWVCHDWYTAFKISDDYDFALVHNSELRKLIKTKGEPYYNNIDYPDVKTVKRESDVKIYYPYIRSSIYNKALLYWVPIKDIINLKDTIII